MLAAQLDPRKRSDRTGVRGGHDFSVQPGVERNLVGPNVIAKIDRFCDCSGIKAFAHRLELFGRNIAVVSSADAM